MMGVLNSYDFCIFICITITLVTNAKITYGHLFFVIPLSIPPRWRGHPIDIMPLFDGSRACFGIV